VGRTPTGIESMAAHRHSLEECDRYRRCVEDPDTLIIDARDQPVVPDERVLLNTAARRHDVVEPPVPLEVQPIKPQRHIAAVDDRDSSTLL